MCNLTNAVLTGTAHPHDRGFRLVDLVLASLAQDWDLPMAAAAAHLSSSLPFGSWFWKEQCENKVVLLARDSGRVNYTEDCEVESSTASRSYFSLLPAVGFD